MAAIEVEKVKVEMVGRNRSWSEATEGTDEPGLVEACGQR